MMLYLVTLAVAIVIGLAWIGWKVGMWGWFGRLTLDYLPLRNLWETAAWAVLFGVLLFSFLVDFSRGLSLILLIVFMLHLRRDFILERKSIKKSQHKGY